MFKMSMDFTIQKGPSQRHIGPHEETNPVGAITTPQQTPLTTIEIKLTVHVKRQ